MGTTENFKRMNSLVSLFFAGVKNIVTAAQKDEFIKMSDNPSKIDRVSFWVGYKEVLVIAEINPNPQMGKFSIKTFTIEDNKENYGTYKLCELKDLEITGDSNNVVFQQQKNPFVADMLTKVYFDDLLDAIYPH